MNRSWQPALLPCVTVCLWAAVCNRLPSAEKGIAPQEPRTEAGGDVVLLDDDFGKLEPGLFSAPVGAHTEYHFLPEAVPRGGWTVACFSSDGSQRAWHVQQEGDRRVMAQTFDTSKRKFHPLLVAGDPLWTDCMNQELVVADGATDKTKYKAPTPASKPPADRYPRILGDCLFFCDLRGRGSAQDLVIKDRYWHFWTLTDRLEPLWDGACRTGHYPFAADVDGDGHDELAIGYALFDHDGRLLWNLEDRIADHADGVAIANFGERPGSVPRIFYAASNGGAVYADLQGNILKHHRIGHVQNPAIADFRPDLPGLEVVSINFWGNQGILHFYDAQGEIYHDCEPNPFGSMCLPVNWTGRPGEYFVHNPNVRWGGMFDGWGRCVVTFPDDGHPDMCNAVLDITGDCRDEVVVWDPKAIWVYTQSDNPQAGRLYRPRRNPLYNYSNYQATVSLPGWSQ